MKRTADGTRVWPLWFVFLFGGTFRQDNGGYGTYPGGVVRQTIRYWRGSWRLGGYNWWTFVDPRPEYIIDFSVLKGRKQSWWKVRETGSEQP